MRAFNINHLLLDSPLKLTSVLITSGPLTPNKLGKWTTQRYFKITLLVFILKYFKQFEFIAAMQVHHLGFNLHLKAYNFRLAINDRKKLRHPPRQPFHNMAAQMAYG